MAFHITIWESGRSWRNVMMLPLAILLLPVVLVLLVVVGVGNAVMWPVRKLFPRKPSTAADMVRWLDVVIASRDSDEEFEAAYDPLTYGNFGDPRLIALQRRIKELTKQLEAMRESACALAGDRT
jgi:hypothetical protein